jgi:hypothetical protein
MTASGWLAVLVLGLAGLAVWASIEDVNTWLIAGLAFCALLGFVVVLSAVAADIQAERKPKS